MNEAALIQLIASALRFGGVDEILAEMVAQHMPAIVAWAESRLKAGYDPKKELAAMFGAADAAVDAAMVEKFGEED